MWLKQADLIDYINEPVIVQPWLPRALTREEWPPNYAAVYAWRVDQLRRLRSDPGLIVAAKAYYSTRPVEFIQHWLDTYDPRKPINKWMPFIFFKKQEEYINFLTACINDQENALIEKSRDMGLTWLSCAWSVWCLLFVKESAIGWGSRKENLIDQLGDPDSIFEKMRLLLKKIPDIFLPVGFNHQKHCNYMRINNPETGSVITGEAGNNIGRGGRKSVYFKDESAHYEQPELIQAALDDNTRVQIDISSVNGLGNVFHRRREAGVDWPNVEPGKTRVFVVDYSDHPEKTPEWFARRRATVEAEGRLHTFAQEVERNYSAAVSNTVIPSEWIRSAIDAHLLMPEMLDGDEMAALDVADDGDDRNALARRKGVVLLSANEWGARDVGVTTRKGIDECRNNKCKIMQYDSVGMGSAIKAEFNRLIDEKIISASEINLVPWNAGAAVNRPNERFIPDDLDSAKNKDMFKNFKAQSWYRVRERFRKIHQFVTQNIIYPADEMISLSSNIPLIRQIEKELAQPTQIKDGNLRMVIDKKPAGTKSPNLADAIIMVYNPVEQPVNLPIFGRQANA